MARYDVYANPIAAERKTTPYFLDVQNDYIDGLATRMVVPLRRESAFGPRARNLNPTLELDGQTLVMDTAALGAVPCNVLTRLSGNLSTSRPDIQDALDTLFGGF